MDRNKRIFLIDDDEDDVAFFKEAIAVLPFPTTFQYETDCEKALELLRKNLISSVDIIYLDFNMPKKDGLACAQEIRQMSRYKETTLIMWTTAIYDLDTKKVYQAGIQDLFLKPNRLEPLVNKLYEHCEHISVN